MVQIVQTDFQPFSFSSHVFVVPVNTRDFVVVRCISVCVFIYSYLMVNSSFKKKLNFEF